MNIPQWRKADMRWYLGVRCRKCQVPILFALDRSEGAEGPLPAAARLVLTCTLESCRYQSDYTAEAVSRFQKQATDLNKRETENENDESRKRKRRA